METDRRASGLGLEVLEHEANDPGKKDFLKFVASVRIRNFAGTTVFWVAETDIGTFAAELSAFATSLKGNPELLCGVGKVVVFKILVVAADNLGHANVRLEIRSENFPPENMVILEFGSEPQLLIDFAADLQRAIVEPKVTNIHLADRPYYRNNSGRPHPGERLH